MPAPAIGGIISGDELEVDAYIEKADFNPADYQ
jgi:hypothetical protein